MLSILVYADEIVLISNSEKKAKKQFKILMSFCNIMQININAKKSATMSNLPNFKLFIKSQPIFNLNKTESYKYLGLWINLDLN